MKQISKEIIISVLTVAANVATFWLWLDIIPLITEGKFQDYILFSIPILSLLSSTCLFSLAVFFTNKWIPYSTATLSVCVPYFFIPASTTIIIALIVSLLLINFAVYRVSREMVLLPAFSLSKFSRACLPIYFTVVSIVISVFYLANIKEEKVFSTLLPRPLFDTTLHAMGGVLGNLIGLPPVDPQKNIDDLITQLINKELMAQGASIKKLTAQELRDAMAAYRKEIANQYSISLRGNEKISDLFYNTIMARLEDLMGPYKKFLPAIAAITFFLAFKTLTLPLYYLTILITYLLIKILKGLKILKSSLAQINVERLTL